MIVIMVNIILNGLVPLKLRLKKPISSTPRKEVAMSNGLLRSIVRIIGQDLVKQSKSNRHIGTQEFHIEEFERLPDKDGAFQFEVTTWSEESDDPRETEIISVADLMGVIARLISFDCFSAIIAEVNKNPTKGAKNE